MKRGYLLSAHRFRSTEPHKEVDYVRFWRIFLEQHLPNRPNRPGEHVSTDSARIQTTSYRLAVWRTDLRSCREARSEASVGSVLSRRLTRIMHEHLLPPWIWPSSSPSCRFCDEKRSGSGFQPRCVRRCTGISSTIVINHTRRDSSTSLPFIFSTPLWLPMEPHDGGGILDLLTAPQIFDRLQ